MNTALESIKAELERTYDIPFYVYEEENNGEPCFCIGPENPGEEFFYIRVSFRNALRVTAEFVPERFGAAFVRSMAECDDAKKDSFLQFVALLQHRGAKVSLSIDHSRVSLEDFKQYTGMWNHLSIKATKAPIAESDEFSYSVVAQEWGSLMMGMVLSMADIVPVEDDSIPLDGNAEGALSKVTANKYERSRINRKLCLEWQGYDCCICGFNFEKKYGQIGHNFIHVHHVVPVSQLGAGYIVNPQKDLVPVCANCHAMLHRKEPPYKPDELCQILKDTRC